MNDVDRLITDEYERHKGEVLRTVAAKLRAAGVQASPADLESPYNEAWHALYMKMSEGEEIGNRVGFLVTVTHRRMLSEYRASRAGLRADESELSSIGVEFDFDSQIDAEIKVRHITEGLRAKLSEREFEAATLCHLHGYSRPEAAQAIGVKPKRMEKIMDGASSRIAAVVERVQAGEHCESMGSQTRAYAVGMLDPEGEKYRQTQEHLEHCPACRREVWVMRGLAAAVPPVPLIALAAGSASTAGVAAHGVAATGVRPEGVAAGASSSGSSSGGAAGAAAEAGGKAGMVVAVSAATAVAAVAAVAVATGTIGGGGSDSPDPPAISSSASAGSESAAKQAAARKNKANAKAKARAKARANARAEKRQQEREAQAEPPVTAQASEPVVVPEPEYVPPAPEYVPPPPPLEPAPTPPPPDRQPSKPTTNASDEFGLR